MAVTVNLRKMIHRKPLEMCALLQAGNTAAGGFIVSDKSNMIPSHDIAYYVGGVSAIWNYNSDNNAWVQLPNSGITGVFGAGSCGEFRAISAPGGAITMTASAGTTTSITTTLNLTRMLTGCTVRVVSGPGSGFIGTVKYNTTGNNSIITFNETSSVAFTSASQYQIFAGSLWFFNAGTTAVGFSVYDRATNTWTARSVTGLPTLWGTEGQLVSTPGFSSNRGLGFVNGVATAGGATTLTTNKTFLLNQWANFQVRIMSGTGAGQIRTISSNTAGANGVLTVSAAWGTNPDATSNYRIEGNDDHFYLFGNAAIAVYKYTISTNTWATLAPAVARSAVPGAGMTADWIDGINAPGWTDETYTNFLTNGNLVRQNGRYIYSLRGAGNSRMDVFDVAAVTWVNNIDYGNQLETFNAGSCSVDLDGAIYIQKEATGRIFKFDVAQNVLDPWVVNPGTQGAAVAGDKMFMTTFTEGPTTINYLYTLGHTRNELYRWIVI